MARRFFDGIFDPVFAAFDPHLLARDATVSENSVILCIVNVSVEIC